MTTPEIPRGLADFGLRVARRFIDMEGAQHATVLSAQAFTSLIPFFIVAAVLAPGDAGLSDRIIERFGLEGASARSVDSLFASSTEVESTVTWVSVVILILATLSFTRAMQRMFHARTVRSPAVRRTSGAVSGLLGALLGIASSIYVPILMDWSARKYGLIGIAFSLQSWMLVFAFVIVIGAVVGAVMSEQFGVIRWRKPREQSP